MTVSIVDYTTLLLLFDSNSIKIAISDSQTQSNRPQKNHILQSPKRT